MPGQHPRNLKASGADRPGREPRPTSHGVSGSFSCGLVRLPARSGRRRPSTYCHHVHSVGLPWLSTWLSEDGCRHRKTALANTYLCIPHHLRAKTCEPAGIRTQDTRIKSLSWWRPWRGVGAFCVRFPRDCHPQGPSGGAECVCRGWQRGWQDIAWAVAVACLAAIFPSPWSRHRGGDPPRLVSNRPRWRSTVPRPSPVNKQCIGPRTTRTTGPAGQVRMESNPGVTPRSRPPRLATSGPPDPQAF